MPSGGDAPLITREECEALDGVDELGPLRAEFVLGEELLYLDGNSLGPLTRGARRRVAEVIDEEWAEGLVRSWNSAGWMELPTRVGDRIAPLIGAPTGTVLVADTLTLLLAKLILGALDLVPERQVILTDVANFHSDLYMVEAMAARAGRPVTVRGIDRERLWEHLDEEVALVMLTHVDFRSGEMLDMEGITSRVHQVGALMLWDLAHSTGAVPVDVIEADVDFAAGCGYKYLNGGPGSPAFLYVHPRFHGVISNPLPGWLGHARPFAFESTFEPAEGVRAFLTSSPTVVALAALDGALDVWKDVTIPQVRAKSLRMTDLFIGLVEARLPGSFEVVTPRAHSDRGSQVSLRHDRAFEITQALIERGVVGDFRDPDICRFGFAPLYLRFVDVYDAVEQLVDVMDNRGFHDKRFSARPLVT